MPGRSKSLHGWQREWAGSAFPLPLAPRKHGRRYNRD